MSEEHSAEGDALRENAERACLALNAAPWWRPIKRQEAAEDYKRALLMGALWEINNKTARPQSED